jgi:hypothetical protein
MKNYLFIFVMVIIILLCTNNKSKTKEKSCKIEPFQKHINTNKKKYVNTFLDDMIYNNLHSDNIEILKKNRNFVDVQFHNDYLDTITAFNNISPNQKQIFNIANYPVVYTQIDKKDVLNIISDFLTELNFNISKDVPDVLNKNSGWDEHIPESDKFANSGWDNFRKNLGLPVSIYNKPATKCEVKLISIDNVYQYETKYEIKYLCYLVLQKTNVSDQIIIRVSLVSNKLDKDLDKKELTPVVIEDIFIIGFLYNFNDAPDNYHYPPDDFYNFEGLESNDIIKDRNIMNQLMNKYHQKRKEMNNRNSTLDDEGQELHHNLPNSTCSDSYKVTRTIFDDFQEPKVFT